jgi:hypothetical protein
MKKTGHEKSRDTVPLMLIFLALKLQVVARPAVLNWKGLFYNTDGDNFLKNLSLARYWKDVRSFRPSLGQVW